MCNQPEFEFNKHNKVEVNLTLSRQEIMNLRTGNGGWKRHTLATLGVSWPPQKGWLDAYLKRRKEILSNQLIQRESV